MFRVKLDPATAYGRHPLRPHQLIDRVTRTEDTIVLCHLGVPRIDPDDWSLTIDGLVRRPMRLTLDDLMRRPRTDITSIHQCCGSPLTPDEPKRRICKDTLNCGGVQRQARPALRDAVTDCSCVHVLIHEYSLYLLSKRWNCPKSSRKRN